MQCIISKQKVTLQKNCWWYISISMWSNTGMELHDAEESMAIKKMLAHDIRMKKNPQTKEDTFWIEDFYGVMWVQSPTCSPARKFQQWRR